MTLLDQLRILRIPGFVKALLALLALGLVALNVYIIYRGLYDRSYDFWIAAGASLLATVAPALAVVSVLVVTESGMGALKRRMQQMLARDIPSELRFTFEAPTPALDLATTPSRLPLRPNPAEVACGMYRDELWANYRVKGHTAMGEPQIADIRIELVMRRINLNLVFDRASILKRLKSTPADLGETFKRAFPHTIGGAKGAGYTFSDMPIVRSGEVGFVATREIDASFVWDPAARLEFIQDLVLMLRAFVTERPDLFAPRTAP